MDYLDYEKLVETALLSTVKLALTQVKAEGLQDPHHFYITFLTEYPGVELPGYLRDEYPEEITIVLQYQFWDLKVQSDHFSVVLSFNDQEETIRVPYKALVSFADPSQNFTLEFNPTLPKKRGKGESDGKDSPAEGASTTHENNVVSIDRFRKK